VTATQTHTHTDEPRLWKEHGVFVCARFWHFLPFSLTPVVGFHMKTTFTDSPINRLPPTTKQPPALSHTDTHTDTRMHSHTRLLYILSPYLIHFFPPKHSLSFRCFQIGTLNGSLSLSSFYRNWCYASNKAHHDFITVSLCFFKQIAPSKLIFFD